MKLVIVGGTGLIGVDVSNSPSFADAAVMEFFTTSTRNLLRQAGLASVSHYVALSVVGTGRMSGSPYFRAKNAQETLIRNAGLPFSNRSSRLCLHALRALMLDIWRTP